MAGGTHVPLDANQPARFRPIIKQPDAKFVLTSATLSEAVSRINGCLALVVDEELLQ